MTRPCECGHAKADHCGFFCDCVAKDCDCRWYEERPVYWRVFLRWLKAVPR